MGRDASEIPLAIESLSLWKGLNARIGDETGFTQTGIAYLCRNVRQEAEYEAWLEHARAYGLDSRLLRKEELRQHLPGMSDGFTAALHTSTDGRAEPFKAAPAIARGAIRAGAHIITGCAVRSIERSGGAVSGVVTERGRIACSSVVLAGAHGRDCSAVTWVSTSPVEDPRDSRARNLGRRRTGHARRR